MGNISEGDQTRSFCYVDGMVEGFLLLMATEHAVTGPVNLGNPHEFTIKELAEKVLAITGSASELVYKPLPKDDPRQRQPDINRAKEALGWESTVALDEGMVKTIEYFRKQLG